MLAARLEARAHADGRELLGERRRRGPRARVHEQLRQAVAARVAGLREQLARALDVVWEARAVAVARHDGRDRAARAGGQVDTRRVGHQRRAVDGDGRVPGERARPPSAGLPTLKPRNVRRERRRALGDRVGRRDRRVPHELQVVAALEPLSSGRWRRSRKAMRTSPTLPVAVRQWGFARQAGARLVDLREHERPVADERLRPAPGSSDLVGAVARPRIRPV